MIEAATRPTKYPDFWPVDNRNTVYEHDGVLFIEHPEREPHWWDSVEGKWKEVK